MQVQVTFTGDLHAIAAVMATLAPSPDVEVSFQPELAEDQKAPSQKRKRRTKEEMARDAEIEKKKPVEDTSNSDVDIDEKADDDDLDYSADDAEETVPEEKLEKKALTLELDIIPAFRAYSQKHSREAAGKILTKLGVKSVKDLKNEQYSGVLKMLRL